MSIQVGVCLLSKDGYYVREDGSLPVRPSWDKAFLLGLVNGLNCLASESTIKTLPESVKASASIIIRETSYASNLSDINLGINSFKNLPELMFIVRSDYPAEGGKLLRLDNYSKLIDFRKDDGGFEIWKLKTLNS